MILSFNCEKINKYKNANIYYSFKNKEIYEIFFHIYLIIYVIFDFKN